MKARRRHKPNPYQLNMQFENAFNWLRSIKVIKSAAHLARLMNVSPTTISDYRNKKRKLGLTFAHRFEEQVHLRHKCALVDIDTDILVYQSRQVIKPSSGAVASLMSTKLIVLEAGQQTILDLLTDLLENIDNIKTEVGELRKQLVTTIAKLSS